MRPDEDYLKKPLRGQATKADIVPLVVGVLSIILASFVGHFDMLDGSACPRESVSHYFYAPVAGTFFVGVLCFVGAFMIAYRGQCFADGVIATIGGLGALLTAFAPTRGLGCKLDDGGDFRLIALEGSNLSPGWFAEKVTLHGQEFLIGNALSQYLHWGGALAIIGSLAVLCIVHWARDSYKAYDTETRSFVARPVKLVEKRINAIGLSAIAYGLTLIIWEDAWWGQSNGSFWAQFFAWFPWNNSAYATSIRPVYHGELIAFVAFGFVWLTQFFCYFSWRTNHQKGGSTGPAIKDS
ncbi:hypothetical protein SLH49_21760 [Cognatiyoonia sp. IB215446]|uniref:hypothetical protein n=1 Tax=Cognatiyoonia sp. IB215446 TaxID=3097355 RepID=UPI002A14276C|nr:hypothetical protein [Cognatiyoonia sp. IB215446]MDX8350625.1 hypothetical protein [Cognatiyoonia sp. IB215446]